MNADDLLHSETMIRNLPPAPRQTPARETCPLFGGPRASSFAPGQGGGDPGLASSHLDATLRFYDVVSFRGSLPRQTEEYFLPRMIQEVTTQVSLGEGNAVFSRMPPSKAGGGPRGQEPWCRSHGTLVARGSDQHSEGVLSKWGGVSGARDSVQVPSPRA